MVTTLYDFLRNIQNDEIILKWKKDYNHLAERARKASDYMENPQVSQDNKNIQFVKYRIEILEPLERYIQIFHHLGIHVPKNAFEGFPEIK